MSSDFIDPVLAKCADRSKLAATNKVIGEPESWFPWTEGVSFDFFINWKNRRLDREVWLKRPVNKKVVKSVAALTDEDVREMLKADPKFRALVDFAGKNGLAAAAMIFDDSQDWTSPSAGLIKATWPANTETMHGLRIDRLTLADLKILIQQMSGGPVPIGDKLLDYGTSCLECVLSLTTAAWAGDVDFVVTDDAGKAIGILEFKKHTSGSGLPLHQQCLANYYEETKSDYRQQDKRKKDRRKYDRLALLAEQLGAKPLKMLIIYYSVVNGCPDLYIEEVHGKSGQLKGGTIEQFKMNPNDVAGSAAELRTLIRSKL